MAIRRVCYLILLFSSAAAALLMSSGVSLVLAAALVAAVVISIPINILAAKGINAAIDVPPSVQKGKALAVNVVFNNNTVIPGLNINCTLNVQNQLNKENTVFKPTVCVGPKAMAQQSLELSSKYCGRLKLSVEKIKLYDCFGIVGIPVKTTATAHTTVQPDTVPINIEIAQNDGALGESDVYSQTKSGNDLTETFQIREYVPGDSPKQVHWKLSGKFDKLIVKEPGLPIIHDVLLFWERTGESSDKNKIDAQAEVVISLAKSLLDASISFTIGWNDTDRNICMIHSIADMDELVGIIPRVLRATGAKNGISGAQLLLKTRQDALCSHMVYIAHTPQRDVEQLKNYGNVTPLICGDAALDGAINFDENSLDKNLGQIII